MPADVVSSLGALLPWLPLAALVFLALLLSPPGVDPPSIPTIAVVLWHAALGGSLFLIMHLRVRPEMRRRIRSEARPGEIQRFLRLEALQAKLRAAGVLIYLSSLTAFMALGSLSAVTGPMLVFTVVFLFGVLVTRGLPICAARRNVAGRGGRLVRVETMKPWQGPFREGGLEHVVRKLFYLSGGRIRQAWLRTNALGLAAEWDWEFDDGDYSRMWRERILLARGDPEIERW